jgi:DNA repair protein RadD
LSPLHSRSSRYKVDCSSLHVRGGEFISAEVDTLVDTEHNVQNACWEIVSLTKDRHSVLIFAVSVKHAEHVKATIEKLTSCECGLVVGDTPAGERDKILRRFKREKFAVDLLGTESTHLKYLVNVNVLTTGFDAPNVDCVVLLRPTASAGLYAQMVGRGFRLHETKTDCLVLDYGGNILRHGPIDAIQIKDKKGQASGEAPMKECPKCFTVLHAAVMQCTDCLYEFPKPNAAEKHDAMAASEGILTGEICDTEYDVSDVAYSVHTKRGASQDSPQTVKVDYQVGFCEYVSQWCCPEHDGWARQKFEKWWNERSNDPPPASAADAVRLAKHGSLAVPTRITVRKIGGEKFPRIIKYQLPDEKPQPIGEMPEESEYYTCGECNRRCNNQTSPQQRACECFEANLEKVPF